jgi:hypothetical protein
LDKATKITTRYHERRGSPRRSWGSRVIASHIPFDLDLPKAIASLWDEGQLLGPTCRDECLPSYREPQCCCHHRAYPPGESNPRYETDP